MHVKPPQVLASLATRGNTVLLPLGICTLGICPEKLKWVGSKRDRDQPLPTSLELFPYPILGLVGM